MALKVLDLFSGIGGFSLGFERAGMETVAFCEYEEHAQKILRKHWPDVPIYKDVRTLDGKQFKWSVDVVCGGFPCQDISIAGKNKGIRGERSGLWSEFRRCIDEVKPKYAVIENVSALLGRGLNVVLCELAQIGYDATYTTLDTKYFGTPQRRRRVYILAVRDGIPANCDPFEFSERCTARCKSSMEFVENGFEWDFTEREREQERFAYFTRQRSDMFAQTGLSSTLAKRDYKSYTDLVLQRGILRRVTPSERMLLQGFPQNWLDGVGLSDKEKFILNGMSVNVVEWIGRKVVRFDDERV